MDATWTLDELAHAGPEHLDPAFVAGFDRKQGGYDAGPDLAALTGNGVGDDATVVDIGAGTGRFTLAAARRFRRVVAVEVSPAMRAVIGGRVAAAGLSNVECAAGGFLSYRREGTPAGAVFSRHALHQLPDFWKGLALDRINRMLRPGGVLRLIDLVYDFRPDEADEVIGGWLAAAVDDPAVGYTRDDYVTHLRTEYSTYRWLLEPMLDRAGFEVVDVAYRGRIFGAYTCVKR